MYGKMSNNMLILMFATQLSYDNIKNNKYKNICETVCAQFHDERGDIKRKIDFFKAGML